MPAKHYIGVFTGEPDQFVEGLMVEGATPRGSVIVLHTTTATQHALEVHGKCHHVRKPENAVSTATSGRKTCTATLRTTLRSVQQTLCAGNVRHTGVKSNNIQRKMTTVKVISRSSWWLRGMLASALASTNEVALHRARLLLGWVTVSSVLLTMYNGEVGNFLMVKN